MKRITKLVLVIIFSQLLTSCFNSDNKSKDTLKDVDFKVIEVNDQYSISVPEYMKESTSLNDEASLQFLNLYKEVYVIVIDEPTEEFASVFKELNEYDTTISAVQNYRKVQLLLLEETISIEYKSDPKPVKINGLDAEIVQVDGSMDGIEVYYYFTYIHGNENLYLIMAWTLKDRKEKYKLMFEKMALSFSIP